MASINRNAKPSSSNSTSFADGAIIEADEVNADFDTIYNDYNGNITSFNLSGTANLTLSQIGDLSATAGEMDDATDPGTSGGGESLATTMEEEIERLRYAIERLAVGTTTLRLDGTAGVDLVSWYDMPQTGPNLIRNGNFAVGLESSVPPGWTNVNTATLALTTTGVTEGHSTMRALRITAAGGALEGVSQTLAGLKASTKYIVGCRAKVTAGDTFRLVTTGADGAVFGNLALSTTSTSYVTLAGQIVTDATPTSIVVQLLAVADTDVADVTHVWVRECATDRLPQSNTAWAYDDETSQLGFDTSFDSSGMTVSVVAPGPGYFIEVHAEVTAQADTATGSGWVTVLRENDVDVGAPGYGHFNSTGDATTVNLFYVNRAPTPGTTYTYTVFAATEANAAVFNSNAYDGETSRCTLRARAVLESAT